MNHPATRWTWACLLALTMACTSLWAQAPAPSGSDMLADLVVTRPLGVLGVIAGCAAFVAALPFTMPSQSVDVAAEELVKKPFRYTFKRPLGELTGEPP